MEAFVWIIIAIAIVGIIGVDVATELVLTAAWLIALVLAFQWTYEKGWWSWLI